MLFEVTHSTRYVYETPVSYCVNEARLTPRTLPNQHIRENDLRITPTPAFQGRRTDYFGNEVVSFGVSEKHDRLEVSSRSVVEVEPAAPPTETSIPWEQARDVGFEASEFVFDSPFVPTFPELADYARYTFRTGRPVLEAVAELSHRIHSEFEYKAASTSIDMPLREVLAKRRGVCQDFAHIMIGALRSAKLAARYVSGYVRPGPKVECAQASHAWVSVFVPQVGWRSFDPTNDVMPSDNHITLGWGRDYADVTPVKGVTLGGGKQAVEVAVYVKVLESSEGQGKRETPSGWLNGQ